MLPDDNVTLDAEELAHILKFSPATIRADVSRRPHMLPPSIKVGTRTVWLRSTVMRWLAERERAAAPPPTQVGTETPRRRRGRPTKADQARRGV